jgi:hypothetical protein
VLCARDSVLSAGKVVLEEWVSLRWKLDSPGIEKYDEDSQNDDLKHISLVEKLRSELWEKAQKTSEGVIPGIAGQSLVDPQASTYPA